MTPERWQEISRIFEGAKSLNDSARAVYIKEQCGGDDLLRSEVERLIDSHQKAGVEDFMEGMAVEHAGLSLEPNENDQPSNSLTEGQQFGSYLIQKKIGVGGMGEVYLATDQRLDRTVALKILPTSVANDKRRMQRFRQEAKVSSSLNQPNIVTIFEFGEIDCLTFLATEFIDGETLREYLRGKRVKLPEILDISIQILAALDAAHEAKIVHRDIKPENVMIRRRDHVIKVLDFGLAKLTEKKTSSGSGEGTDTEAATEFKSMPGSLMGTINYMSPEQAQAQPVDPRTDIWSTGVMIYEMVAGVMPFKGATSAHTIVQIIEKEPTPLTQLDPMLPAELRRIVAKAMAKRFDERYQTAKDMMIDLRSLRKQIDATHEVDRPRPEPQQLSAASTAEQKVTTNELQERVVRGRRRVSAAALIPLAVAVLAIVATLIVWNRRQVQKVSIPPPVPERKLTYSITVQKYRNDRPFEEPFKVAREMLFERGYQLRLNIQSPQSGYLYVINEGPRELGQPPEYVVLFPSPTSNGGSAILGENVQLQIPEKSWLRLDNEKGTEKVWLIFAPKEIADLEPVREFANSRTRGLIDNSSVRDKVTTFLEGQSNNKAVAQQNDEKKMTTLSVRGDLLVHALALEHQ